MSALRISASLERMGDIAEHIAQLARYRFPEKVVPKALRPTFTEMGELDVEIARKLTELLRDRGPAPRRGDPQRRRQGRRPAPQRLRQGARRELEGRGVDTVDATLASRYHERFADHAVSIAKKVSTSPPATGPSETDAIDLRPG